MTSQPRQYHEDYWYHVYARGQRGEPLFFSPDDRCWFLDKLDAIFTRRQVLLGSYCLMTNHTHLLVKMGEVSLARVLQSLHMRYAKYFNNKRNTDGHVFQGRPGVKIVLNDSYLLQLVPYIHNNPVKAGIVENAKNYEWSSDSMFRSATSSSFELECWKYPPGFQDSNRERIYLEHMETEIEGFDGGEGYIGTESDWQELEKRRNNRKDRFRNRRNRRSMDEITKEVIDHSEFMPEDLQKPGRSQPEARFRQRAMFEMYKEGYGHVEIGEYFNRSKGTVGHAIKKYQSEE